MCRTAITDLGLCAKWLLVTNSVIWKFVLWIESCWCCIASHLHSAMLARMMFISADVALVLHVVQHLAADKKTFLLCSLTLIKIHASCAWFRFIIFPEPKRINKNINPALKGYNFEVTINDFIVCLCLISKPKWILQCNVIFVLAFFTCVHV